MRREYAVAATIAAGLLFWAVGKHGYDYFVLLRWVVSVVAVFGVWVHTQAGRAAWRIPLVLIALLFNPVFPVHLTRPTWAVIDILTGVVFLASWLPLRPWSPPPSAGSP